MRNPQAGFYGHQNQHAQESTGYPADQAPPGHRIFALIACNEPVTTEE